MSAAFPGSVASSDGVATSVAGSDLGEGDSVQLNSDSVSVSLEEHSIFHPEEGWLAASVEDAGEVHVYLERSTDYCNVESRRREPWGSWGKW